MIVYFLLTDGRLCQKGQIEFQNKKKKSHAKKVTGFQVFDSFLNENPVKTYKFINTCLFLNILQFTHVVTVAI